MAVRKVKEVCIEINLSKEDLMEMLVANGIVTWSEVPSDWHWYINCDENGLVVHWSTKVRHE